MLHDFWCSASASPGELSERGVEACGLVCGLTLISADSASWDIGSRIKFVFLTIPTLFSQRAKQHIIDG